MVRRQPLPHIRWHQEPLIPIHRSITLGHHHILPKTPGQSTAPRRLHSATARPTGRMVSNQTSGPPRASHPNDSPGRPCLRRMLDQPRIDPQQSDPVTRDPASGGPYPDAKPAFRDLHGAGEGDRRPTLPVPPTAAPACGVTGGTSESPTFPAPGACPGARSARRSGASHRENADGLSGGNNNWC